MVEIYFQKIDENNRGDHPHLTSDDEIYFLREYTSGQNFKFSTANNIISNLKKKPSKSHLAEYSHKIRAMKECAEELSGAIHIDWLKTATLVPVPSSKIPGDPEHDDRMGRICRAIKPSTDVREIVRQKSSIKAAHECTPGERPKVQDLLNVYEIDESKTNPIPISIGIVDDVMTAGTHYRAMQMTLSRRFPGVPIVGFFIARRIFPPVSDFTEVDIPI